MATRFTARRWLAAAGLLFAAVPALAQYPGRVQKNLDTTPPLRATGVYEWTGDLSKPKAGRLVPIAVWDGQDYQPGALYLAQPAPLAVLTGTVYELQQTGTPKGLFTVSAAENLSGSYAGNWWIGIGSVKPDIVVAQKKLPPSKHPPQVVKDAGSDSDRPVLHRKDQSDSSSAQTSSQTGNASGSSSGSSASGSGSASGTASADPDKPTLHRRDSTDSSGSTPSTGNAGSTQSAPTVDPDRPTLHRKDSADDSSSSTAPSVDPDRPTLHRKDTDDSSANAPSVDPDRPTLHQRSNKSGDTTAPVTATANIDPDRPKLRHGKPEVLEGAVEPSKLEGIPANMNQMAAISDAKSAEPHSFAYSWADPGDAAKMQAALEDLARKALIGNATSPLTAPPAKPAAQRSRSARKPAAPAPAPLALADEKFSAFELSYSGGATIVFTAKATPSGDTEKYVTLIAQPDFYGTPQVIFTQTTSNEQLDIKPRMQLVDAADTDGDHRAELIFEMAGKTGRAFSIYRVVNAHAEEAFNTGALP